MFQKFWRFQAILVVLYPLATLAHSAMGSPPADPIRIKAGDPDPFDSFGRRAVSISGDLALIGAFWDDANGPDSGAGYLFQVNGMNWVEIQKLVAADGGGGEWFGSAVASQADTVLVAALGHVDDDASGGGAVYVFRFNGSTWTEVQELFASDGASGDGFGRALAISGDAAIIGAPSVDADDLFISGAAYVFRFDSERLMWIEEAKLLPPELPRLPGLGLGFGLDVALHGGIAVIGELGNNSACPKNPICSSGAAYVFRYDAETESWVEEQELLASDAACGDQFGLGVAVGGEVALIGAPFEGKGAGPSTGSVYVFRFDGQTSQWVEQDKLLASDGAGGDQFGRSVAMDGDLAVIGAWLADPVGGSSGAAYVFRQNALGVWVEQCKLLPEPNVWTQFFGRSIDIDGSRVIIGAHGEDQQQGAAYIFDLSFNPADLDADGAVGPFDLALLLGNWGPCPEPCAPGDPTQTCPADLSGDCIIDAIDLAILLGNWG